MTTVEPSARVLLLGIWPVAWAIPPPRPVGKAPVGVAMGGLSVLFSVTVLHVLEQFLGAKLRERGDRDGYVSMIEKLPTWIKAAKNRDELLRAIARLRTTLPSSPDR